MRNQLRNLVRLTDRENAVAAFNDGEYPARRPPVELTVTKINAVRANDGRKLAKWRDSDCVVLHE